MRDPTFEDQVRSLRAFNRAYTSWLGLLNSHLDDSPFSLSEARVLYEIGHGSNVIAADVARVTRMDRAQLSRTLQRFRSKQLVESEPADGRSQILRLSKSGKQALQELERGTQRAVGALLAQLSISERKRLLDATATIAGLLGMRERASYQLRDLRVGDIGWVIHRC